VLVLLKSSTDIDDAHSRIDIAGSKLGAYNWLMAIPGIQYFELIKKRRTKKGVTEYLLKWKGYNNRHNTWQTSTMKTLENSKRLIIEFDHTHTALVLMNDTGLARHLL
jgi:hypothetical protein